MLTTTSPSQAECRHLSTRAVASACLESEAVFAARCCYPGWGYGDALGAFGVAALRTRSDRPRRARSRMPRASTLLPVELPPRQRRADRWLQYTAHARYKQRQFRGRTAEISRDDACVRRECAPEASAVFGCRSVPIGILARHCGQLRPSRCMLFARQHRQ